MADTERKLRVFLCHAKEDKPVVRELYQRLKSEGWIDVWLDEEKLFPGQDWNYEIEKAVDEADIILACLTKGSVSKEGYVQRELRIVLDLADYKHEGSLFIIPVRLEECEPPRRLRAWQYADYFPREERARAYDRLLTSLKMRARKLDIPTVNPAAERKRKRADEDARKEKEAREKKEAEEHARKEQEERERKAVEERFYPRAEQKPTKEQVGDKRITNKPSWAQLGLGLLVALFLIITIWLGGIRLTTMSTLSTQTAVAQTAHIYSLRLNSDVFK